MGESSFKKRKVKKQICYLLLQVLLMIAVGKGGTKNIHVFIIANRDYVSFSWESNWHYTSAFPWKAAKCWSDSFLLGNHSISSLAPMLMMMIMMILAIDKKVNWPVLCTFILNYCHCDYNIVLSSRNFKLRSTFFKWKNDIF